MNILPARPATKASCPDTGHEPAIHPPGGYHVLRRVAGGYLAVTSKRLSRWDPTHEPAWWQNADAARKWASREYPETPTLIEPCNLDAAPCLLRPRRKGPRPVKIDLAELQAAVGQHGGKRRLLAMVAAAFGQSEDLR